MTQEQLKVLAQLATALDAANNCKLFSAIDEDQLLDWQSIHQLFDAIDCWANGDYPINS